MLKSAVHCSRSLFLERQFEVCVLSFFFFFTQNLIHVTRYYVGFAMAVQQNKKSVARRGNRRAHDFLTNPPTAIEATTGEVHRRHHISPTGFYRGKKVIATKADE